MKINNLKVLAVFVIALTLLAFGLRYYASERINIDDDETTYLISSLKYTNYIRSGQYSWIAWNTTNYEHPSFYKIIYGVALLPTPPLEKIYQSDFMDQTPVMQSGAVTYGIADRRVSVVFGSLTVLALSIVNPLAGLFLAVNSLAVKYTSEIYLEALPMLTSLLAVIAYGIYYRSAKDPAANKKKMFLWLALSGVFLGITAASKYVYCIAGLAILLHWLVAVIRKEIPAKHLLYVLGWGVLSLLLFFICDPYLWPHPLGRLLQSINYHLRFKNSLHVAKAGYPFWQSIVWLFNPFAYYQVQSQAGFLVQLDPLIFILAVLGLPRTFKRSPVFFYWFFVGLIFLFIWSTKWPQYSLVIMAPFCVAAAYGVTSLFDLVKQKLFHREAVNR
jgi:hypothetical protein